MTYSIYKSNGTLLLTLADQTADTSVTPLTLVGRGLLNFGKFEAENFVHLLENFAAGGAPAHPMVGQFWWDTTTGKMKVWNGTVWLRSLTGLDDANTVPGLIFGAGLTINAGTLTANVRSVAGRTSDVLLGVSDIAGAAPLLSPILTGAPQAPTPTTGSNDTRIATTAYVRSQILADTLNYSAGDGLAVVGPNLAVVGTTNRITVSNNGVDIASTYAGQNSISTVGNVTSGQWNATVIPLTKGGTGGTSASEARANISALQYNSLADGLRTVGNGFIVNNNGSAQNRSFVSGSPDTLSVTNGDGVGGNVTIALIGSSNTGPLGLAAGGTGATTKTAAMNALSPATNEGDIIIYGTGGHERLAGKTDAGKNFFLTSGNGTAKPRWTTDLDATTLGGSNAAYFLDRSHHTGTIDANTLGGKTPASYLDYANFTGNFPSTAVITGSTDLANLAAEGSGYVRFNGGFVLQWGRVSGYYTSEVAVGLTFPVAFTKVFSVTTNVIVVSNNYQDWWTQIVSGSLTAGGCSVMFQHADSWKGQASTGYYWTAFGYIG
jgi:hypothetical protein